MFSEKDEGAKGNPSRVREERVILGKKEKAKEEGEEGEGRRNVGSPSLTSDPRKAEHGSSLPGLCGHLPRSSRT